MSPLWADGIHLGIRLGEGKLCLLVMVGVRADGRKELVALADGYRESAGSWADLLRDCARRGMRAPVLAVGDGALGFWTAVREVFPQARTQRCWFHKIANVLGALPKSAHPGAKKALAEIWNAEDKDHARTAVKAFAAVYGAKFPKAAAKITADEEELLAFYDYPAEHWVHLRTTNPIESTFATVRLRTKVTKGHGSKAAALAMAFKLIESAQRRWRMVNAPPGRARPRRVGLRQRQAHRTTRGRGRRDSPAGSRLKDLDPQVLTITPVDLVVSLSQPGPIAGLAAHLRDCRARPALEHRVLAVIALVGVTERPLRRAGGLEAQPWRPSGRGVARDGLFQDAF